MALHTPAFVKDVLDDSDWLALGAALEQGERWLMMSMVMRAREDATAAVMKLLRVDPTDAISVKWCQDEVMRYSDIVRWLRSNLESAGETFNRMTGEDQLAIDEEIFGPSPTYNE